MFIFCAVQDDLDFEFDPVSEPSDQERADLAKCGTDNIVTAYNAGLISQRTALREMKQQSSRTGTWTNITDEEIMNASDEIEPQGEMGGFPGMDGEEDGAGGPDLPHAGRGGEVGDKPPEAHGKPPQAPRSVGDSDWAEDKHPRDEGGWFTSSGGAARPRKYKKKVVKLPAQEYALAMHELNTYLPAGQKKKKFVHKAIGNYMYTVRVNGIDDYEIVRKVPIK